MKRELSYQFDLDIQRVYLLINMKCDVQLWWKSGKGKIATKNSIKLNGSEKFFDIRQKLSIIAKIVIENGVLRQKKTELLIILFTSQNTSKLGGRVYLNLSEFISPQNLTASVSKRFEKSLQNCPDETSKIYFNLSCKYIEENMTTGSQNIQDISFQANTFTTNFGGKIADMTFRPQKQANYRRQSTPFIHDQSLKSNEFLSKQKPKEEYDKEKQDTPTWDKSYRQRQASQVNYNPLSTNREREKQASKAPQVGGQHIQKPMEFSFNPLTPVERQKLGFDNSQIIRQLKQIAQQRGKTIKTLQDELSRLRNQVEQKSEKLSTKSINLINELNLTTNMKDQLQREKFQIISEMEKVKQENRRLQQKSKMAHLQFSDANSEYISKLQQRKKTIEQLSMKLEQSERRASRLQDELFRKQNEIITKEKQFINSNMSRENLTKEQSQKLKSISIALKQLQGNFEKLYQEKQEIRRKNEELIYNLQKSDELSKRMSQNMMKLEQQLIKEKQKSKLVEAKFIQRQSIIQQIESEFNTFSQEKNQIIKQKDDQLGGVREKMLNLSKRLQQVLAEDASMKNTISEKNIRIKSLQTICEQQEKGLQEKQDLIAKAKQYFSVKEKELEEKKAEILKKDEFIQKCRAYIETKQAQYSQILSDAKNTTQGEIAKLRTDLKGKEEMLQSYINEAHRTQKQIEDMQIVIENTKARIMDLQDYIEQLQRKIESQEETLKDLVKKNLDMQIQLNIKDYEIQSLRKNK